MPRAATSRRIGPRRYGSRRIGWISAGVVGLLLATAGIATADTELGHRGRVGRHHLRDTATHPGALCWTPAETDPVGRVVVRPPVVFAIDRTAGVDRQLVGWQARLQRETTDGWKTVDRSALLFARATDEEAAHFERTQFRLRHPGTYRVRVLMVWRRDAEPHIVGAALHEVDFYRNTTNGPTGAVTEGSCTLT